MKQILISSCRGCHHCIDEVDRDFCTKGMFHVKDSSEIHKDCPLQDAPEMPTRGEMVEVIADELADSYDKSDQLKAIDKAEKIADRLGFNKKGVRDEADTN